MGLSADMRQREDWQVGWTILENIFTMVFLVEMGCKLHVLRARYWADNWNRLDALLVFLCVADCWVLTPVLGEDGASNMQQFSVI